MDVLELPRPVINFLRTMAKEGCRYVLSWDIFGGTDAVTLSLTWKLNDHPSSIAKSPDEKIYDDLPIHQNDSIASVRRSRRDQNQNPSTSAIFRSSRDPVYANLSPSKSPTNPSSSLPANNHPPSALPLPPKQQYDIPMPRKVTASTPMNNDTYSKLKRINHLTTPSDDDDTLDPWVKRFECSLEDKTPDSTGKAAAAADDDDIDQSGHTSSKVKFKRKPDYF